LGNANNGEKKPGDAPREDEAAPTQSQGDPAAVAAKIATLTEQSRGDEAITTAKTAVATDPKNPAAHELLGRLYALKNDTAAAEAAVAEALRLDRGFVPARRTTARLPLPRRKPARPGPHQAVAREDHTA